jgi:hypothetical protein
MPHMLGTKAETGKSQARAPFNERPKWKHGFNKSCRSHWRVLDREVSRVDEEIAHVDDHGVGIGHVRRVVPPVGESVDGLGLGGTCLEPPAETRQTRLRCVRIQRGGQMWTSGFEVFGEGGGWRRYGEVG